MFATMKSIACAFLLMLSLASALPWEGPDATASNSLKDMGFSPKPSAAPAALFAAYELRKRQTTRAATTSSSFIHATCGFLTGDPENPLTCINSGYKCAVDVSRTVFGCCSDLAACTIRTSCLPQSELTACDTNCQQDPFIAKCNPTIPFCNQNLLVASGSPTLTNWYCDDSPTIVTQFARPTSGEGSLSGSYAYVTLALLTYSSSTRSSSSTSTSSTKTTTTPAVILVTVTPTPTPTPHPSSKKKAPIGAIVGGVVGGIAVLIAAIVACICIKRKNKKPDPVAPVMAQTAPVEAPPGHTGPFYGPMPGQTKQPGVGGFYQPAIAEKDAGQVVQQQERAEMYSPPHSPAPQYTPTNPAGQQPNHQVPHQGGSPNVYPNITELDSNEISSQARPGTY